MTALQRIVLLACTKSNTEGNVYCQMNWTSNVAAATTTTLTTTISTTTTATAIASNISW